MSNYKVGRKIKNKRIFIPRIKVGSLHTNSIGHLAHEADMYLSSNEHHGNNLVFWIPGNYISNHYLYEIICKKLRISQNRVIKTIYKIATKVRPLSRFLIANVDCSPRNRYLLNYSETKFVLPDYDLEVAKSFLRDNGWTDGQKIVVLCIRDNLYQLKRDPQSKVQNFRNSTVKDFLPAVKFLCSEGFFVIRMGKIAAEKFPLKCPSFLDYAFAQQKTDLLDITLFAHANFVISTGTGLDQIGEIFRKPVLRVNYLPVGDIMTRSRNNRVLPKVLAERSNNTRIDLDEIVRRGLFLANSDEEYERAQVKVVGNHPSVILEEIRYFVGKQEREISYNFDLQKTFSKYMREQVGFKEEDAPLLSPLWRR